MNINFEKLKATSWAMLVLALSATLIPGCLFVFLFERSLFIQLETMKVVLLGIGLTLPFFLTNAMIYVIWEGGLGESTESNGFQTGVLAGSFFTLPVVYLPLILYIFFRLSSFWGFVTMIGMELIVFSAIVYLEVYRSKP